MQKGVSTLQWAIYPAVSRLGQTMGAIYGLRYKELNLNDNQTIARDAKRWQILPYDAKAANRTPVRMRFAYPTIDYQFQAGDAIYEDINRRKYRSSGYYL